MLYDLLLHNLTVGYLLKTFQKEERKVQSLSAVEMFKATHNSKKDGYSKDVQDAIVSHSCNHAQCLCLVLYPVKPLFMHIPVQCLWPVKNT